MQFGGPYGRPRPEDAIDGIREQARRALAIREELADIVGEATGEDGTVRAVVGATGLQELTLEPRAMRKPSADLAVEIVDVTNSARENFDALRAEKAAELGASRRPSLEESLAHLDRLNSMVQSGHGDIQTVFERFRDEATGRR